MATMHYEEIDLDQISSRDLSDAGIAGCIHETIELEDGREINPSGTLMGAYKVYRDEDDTTPCEAIVLYVDGGYRIGFAAGADADWGDFRSDAKSNASAEYHAELEAAISDYLTDAAAWEARL